MIHKLIPAYGRDYANKADIVRDWAANKDFVIADMSSRWDGRPINREQTSPADTIQVRYRGLTKIASFKSNARPSAERPKTKKATKKKPKTRDLGDIVARVERSQFHRRRGVPINRAEPKTGKYLPATVKHIIDIKLGQTHAGTHPSDVAKNAVGWALRWLKKTRKSKLTAGQHAFVQNVVRYALWRHQKNAEIWRMFR